MPSLALSTAADRNKQPILDVLRQIVPEHGAGLEIASGTGQHVAWFAAALPEWIWQPSDATPNAFTDIETRVAHHGLANVRRPVVIDVTAPTWPLEGAQFDLVYCANMLHIAPWHCCAALMQGSAQHLAPGGVLVTYGPYLEHGVPTSEGNLAFDHSLRARDPAWGIRYREDVEQTAAAAGLRLAARHAMPANNLLLVWMRASAAPPT
ncbi:MAG: SAM-dependent methyltransferase [Rhodoferax sp.]|nr:SAM-dependent methyltransferase [Rhodoferax sp.]